MISRPAQHPSAVGASSHPISPPPKHPGRASRRPHPADTSQIPLSTVFAACVHHSRTYETGLNGDAFWLAGGRILIKDADGRPTNVKISNLDSNDRHNVEVDLLEPGAKPKVLRKRRHREAGVVEHQPSGASSSNTCSNAFSNVSSGASLPEFHDGSRIEGGKQPGHASLSRANARAKAHRQSQQYKYNALSRQKRVSSSSGADDPPTYSESELESSLQVIRPQRLSKRAPKMMRKRTLNRTPTKSRVAPKLLLQQRSRVRESTEQSAEAATTSSWELDTRSTANASVLSVFQFDDTLNYSFPERSEWRTLPSKKKAPSIKRRKAGRSKSIKKYTYTCNDCGRGGKKVLWP